MQKKQSFLNLKKACLSKQAVSNRQDKKRTSLKLVARKGIRSTQKLRWLDNKDVKMKHLVLDCSGYG